MMMQKRNEQTESRVIYYCNLKGCHSMKDLIRINHGEEIPKFLCFPHFEHYRPKTEWHDIKRKEITDRATNQRLEQTRNIVAKQNPLYANTQK